LTVTERLFEEHIEWWLLEHGGYSKSSPANFDRHRGLDLVELGGFIRSSQPKAWSRLVSLHGGEDQALVKLADRVAAEIDDRGTVDVLRHGVIDLGVEIRLAFFRPAHGLTPELEERYQQNRVTLTRQLNFEEGSGKDIDLALLVNGIPTTTAELKNPLTGQGIDHAVAQYRHQRDPANVTLSRRALVHFAVDPNEVKMTTKLVGASTVFLPFNRGFDGSPGNPPNPDGHRTFYLWEWVWQRDAWLDLLHRFIQVSEPSEGSRAKRRANRQVIFPRFHQWDAVRQLVAHARDKGAGQSYLVEHSAGSGKSNTIAWLAHRLSNLHDASDGKVFDKVVVITDRLVLDRQLQETIYQFEHVRGVVEKIDESSAQLAEALAGEQAKVVITTLQKFPFILDKVEDLPGRRYAVIIDEAHSSQTGEGARELRRVLGTTEEDALAAAESEEAVVAPDPQDQMSDLIRGRGRQPNLSFFAFTATPKAKTLELFGTALESPEGWRYAPFHLYSMRQAIEEGFILDVLAHYTTYQSYYRIERAIQDDPEYDKRAAKVAIARFLALHPHNLAQKAEIVVEHFRQHTAGKIGGQAKAMVVTSSRLHAVRYKQAIDRYIRDKGYTDVAALVAFSGRVFADGETFTEANMNAFPDSQTATRFGNPEYQVLIVAEKFQTGFDQPLLHTMFVDKTLTGLAAVQTLSRLNRTYSGKEDTFVLDFRNDVDDIKAAFEPWYEATVAVETDPNVMYDMRRRLDDWDLLRPEEVEALVAALQTSGRESSPKTYAAIDPARQRFLGLSDDHQEEARDAIRHFTHAYRFLSQVVTFTDVGLEKDYLFAKALEAVLPGQETQRLDLGSEVKLTHLRIEQTFEGSASLKQGGGDLKAIFDGRGGQHELDLEPLSRIVDQINERFGLNLGDADQLLFDQYEQEWLDDETLAAQARNNDLENFRLVFNRRFMDTIVSRMDANEEIFKRILDEPEFRATLFDHYLGRVFSSLRLPTRPDVDESES
jgi:type I restriction enzyme R subunit